LKRTTLLLSTIVLTGAAIACGGSGGERTLPASPVAPGETNSANITAPTVDSPSDDQVLDTIRPTLTVNNASSSGSGSRTYEFQISDVSGFASTAGALVGGHAVTLSLSGIPEGNGKTSFTPQADLLPSTRYYWRARALQGASIGPWSSTSRFRTKVDTFKSGNSAFDILTDGRTAADENSNVSLLGEGAKTNAENSYLLYKLTALPEGEVSFATWRVKPGNNGKLFTMQDGSGDFNSNPFRAFVEKRGGELRFNFAGSETATGFGFVDNTDYYFKIEWRGGTARLRVYRGTNDGGSPVSELSVGYGAPYGATAPSVTLGARTGDTMRDVRFRRLYIGQNARPVG
jgi:hypothetical protein